MWDYTDKVLDFFHHPKNVGTIDDPDGVGEVESTKNSPRSGF